MSLNSLASSYVGRVGAATPSAGSRVSVSGDDRVPQGIDPANALSALVEYIPAESVSLYLTISSLLPAIGAGYPLFNARAAFWFCFFLTPVLFVLILLGKRKAAGNGKLRLKELPLWPLVAATIAFAVWALAVPGSPYLTDDGGRAIAALVAVFASLMLGVMGRWLG